MGICEMLNTDWKPWWEKPNEFLLFNEQQNFVQGAVVYNPANRQNIMMSMINSGYVNSNFAKVNPYTGKKSQ
jgi:hypothetical protein